jgi:serine beta-lactamase-like protein LACTB, mitochondrial
MRHWLLIVAATAALAPAPASAQPAPRLADHVIVIMIDGARPDVLRAVHTPNLDALAEAGTRYLQARTVYPSQTRVAFVSLPTGAHPGSHGIIGGEAFKDAEWNWVSLGGANPAEAHGMVARPTIFEEATAAGLTSLYAASKGYELVGARGATWTIDGSKTADRMAYATRYQPAVAGSGELAFFNTVRLTRDLFDQTVALIREQRPNLVVLNLAAGDYAGHTWGPHSSEYRRAFELIDGLVGELLAALGDLGIRDRTTLIVSADHGFTAVESGRLVAERGGGNLVMPLLTERGIEHAATNTGGTSLALYVRDKTRVPQVADLLRAQPWLGGLYCEVPEARCDRTLRELKAYFPGRSPDLMVDLDDDANVNNPNAGGHGSLRPGDMRIPLVLSGAGVARGRIEGEGSLVDVAPTIVRLLGLPGTHLKPDGQVLEAALGGALAAASDACARAPARASAPLGPDPVARDGIEPSCSDSAAFRRIVGDFQSRQQNAAISIGVCHRGRTVFREATGFASLENRVAADPDMAFSIASVTKAFTGVALLQLVEAGRLELDVEIQRYVPDFPRHPSGRPVTVRMLAHHLGSVRHWGPERSEQLYARHLGDVHDILALFRDDPWVPDLPPLTRYSYSSYGYNVLAMAIQRASGMPFQRYLEEAVLRPLDLPSVQFDRPGLGGARRPSRYSWYDLSDFRELTDAPQRVPDWDYSHNMAGGGLIASVADLLTFGRALRVPGLLTAESIARIWTQPTLQGVESRMSFGWFPKANPARIGISGSNAGVQAGLTVWKDQDLVVAVLANSWGRGSRSGELMDDGPDGLIGRLSAVCGVP